MRSAVLRLPSRITVLMNLLTRTLLYSGSAASSRLGISLLRGISQFLVGIRNQGSGTGDQEHSVLIPDPRSLVPSPLLLRPLRSVFRAALLPSLHADGIERSAHDVIAHARQILDAAAANEHQRVLLQVMSYAGDVGRDLNAIGQAHARDLAQRGIRLLRRLREHAHAHTALLRADLERRALGLGHDLLPPLADELTDSRHVSSTKRTCGTARSTRSDACVEPTAPNVRSRPEEAMHPHRVWHLKLM